MFDYSKVNMVVDKIVDELAPQKIIVFGSVARHEANDDSDIDIVVVMDTDVHPMQRGAAINILLSRMLIDTDIIVITPEEYDGYLVDERSFINHAITTGYVAYEA